MYTCKLCGAEKSGSPVTYLDDSYEPPVLYGEFCSSECAMKYIAAEHPGARLIQIAAGSRLVQLPETGDTT